MKGTHRIVVQNKRIRYDFEVRRNLTILRGESATGKTTLIDMIRDYYENGESSGVKLQADKECMVLSGRNWKSDIALMQDSIIFIDEGNEFVFTDEFSVYIQQTDHYFVIVTREGIPSLPYSVEEIYGIRNSGKYGTLKQTYNEWYHIYHKGTYQPCIRPNRVIVEDSNSGYQFFCGVVDNKETICVSAGGKSGIFAKTAKMLKENFDSTILVIADGAAFGSEMEKMSRLMNQNRELYLYLPESFEWIILKSGVVNGKGIQEILDTPGEWIESKKYFSWERFFTALLTDKTADTYLKYSKHALNPSYFNDKIREKILETMKNIQL